MNIGNMAKGMNEVHSLIDAIIQTAASEGEEGREDYSLDLIRMQNELRDKYAALQQQLSDAREDSRRLDYMIANGAHVESVADGLCRLGYLATEEYGPLSDTERGAIDGAMIAEEHAATLQRDRQP